MRWKLVLAAGLALVTFAILSIEFQLWNPRRATVEAAYVAADSRFIVIDGLAEHAAFSGYEMLRVDPAEEYAANCIRVNGVVFLPAGFPKTAALLRSAGHHVMLLDMSEFRKMDGGLSCLSLRFCHIELARMDERTKTFS